MGTNYYLVKEKHCEHCGHTHKEEKHIGKSSAGWKFLFYAKTAPNFKLMMKQILDDEYRIEDEYRAVVNKYTFFDFVLEKQIHTKAYTSESYAKETNSSFFDPHEYIDAWGFRFTHREFR